MMLLRMLSCTPTTGTFEQPRRVLGERAASAIAESAVAKLRDLALKHEVAARRVRGLWALHAIGQLDDVPGKATADENEFVRAWAIQLGVENQSQAVLTSLTSMARRDDSLLVCRYLASAVQRVPAEMAWEVVELLAQRPDLETDRDLPSLLWFGIAPLLTEDTARALSLAQATPSAILRDNILGMPQKHPTPRVRRSRRKLSFQLETSNGGHCNCWS